jgi:two-component system CheB/CheR fusion protein
MPQALFSYVRNAFSGSCFSSSSLKEGPAAPEVLPHIFSLLRAQIGHDFSHYKPSTICRRLERRMAVHQISDSEKYLSYLEDNPLEVEALFRDLLIGVTNFFRDPSAFEFFETEVLGPMLEGKPQGASVRIWTPACSTGEEAYSLAILLAEAQERMKRSFKVQLFATDIDKQAIAVARQGSYPASHASDISPERLSRYFEAESDGQSYRIHKSIRDMLIFSEQDIIRDPPFSKLDMITCRNLLIYLDSSLQKKLIPLFHYALNPGGVLFLGSSETLGEHDGIFSPLSRKEKLYQKKDGLVGAVRSTYGSWFSSRSGELPVFLPEKVGVTSENAPPLRELTEQALLKELNPVAALVNAQGDILYLHGRSGRYLEPTPGQNVVNNIIKMAREGLQRSLTTALHRAATKNDTVRYSALKIKTNGSYTFSDLSVSPVLSSSPRLVKELSSTESLFLVVLKKCAESSATAVQEVDLPETSPGKEAGVDSRIAELRRELQAKEDYLQSTNEELETSNEELKSSNEEMQSVNEELQSANEELETSKEELQSVNEELSTVNTELQSKVADLSRANNDMNNLLAGTGIGTVFVDHSLRIMRFTPAATQLINLIPGDVGRPVSHLVSNLRDYETLSHDVQAVLKTLVPREKDVETTSGSWYAMRIQPYRTLENVIEGAVITFVDITEREKTKLALRESEYRFKQLAESLPQLVWTCKTDGLVDYLCSGWLEYTGVPEGEQLNFGWLKQVHSDDQSELISLWNEAVASERPFTVKYRIRHHSGAYNYFEAYFKDLRDEQGRIVKWFALHEEQSPVVGAG